MDAAMSSSHPTITLPLIVLYLTLPLTSPQEIDVPVNDNPSPSSSSNDKESLNSTTLALLYCSATVLSVGMLLGFLLGVHKYCVGKYLDDDGVVRERRVGWGRVLDDGEEEVGGIDLSTV
jgi:hypothetical protein